MERSYRQGEVEKVMQNLIKLDVPDDAMEGKEDYQIVISGWWVQIPELGIQLYEGTYCNFDENEQEYMPDFSITVIKEEGEADWIYYEQEGFLITLSNWLHGREEIERLEQMLCFICKPNE